MSNHIYLDYNATAPLRPEALEVMMAVLGKPHNASSVHRFGREARKIVEDARQTIADIAGIPAAQIIFNSGATEANNTVLKYFAGTYPDEQILISATEHPSVREVIEKTIKIPVDHNGIVNLEALEELLQKKTALVSVMLVNNETGVIQPIEAIAALTHKYGALLHCDATQAMGRININMPTHQIDFMSLSSHKIGGPQGVGALALGMCGITPVLLEGGGQEKRARAGTENIAGIAGFAAAANAAIANLEAEQNRLKILRDKLEASLLEIDNRTIIFGKDVARVSNTTLFALPGLSAETLMMNFDLEGIALSNGSACSSGTVKASPVLHAMGVNESAALAALRVSTGWNTQDSDINQFITTWSKIHARLKEKIHA